MPTTDAIIRSACDIAQLTRDLQETTLDADAYAMGIMDMLGQQHPGMLLVGCPAKLELLEQRLASLLGCLTMGRRIIKKLKAQGVGI